MTNPIEETIKDVIYNRTHTQTNACEGVSVGRHSGIGDNEKYVKVVIGSAADKPVLKEWMDRLRDLGDHALVPVFCNEHRILLVDFSSRPYPVGPIKLPGFSASHTVDVLEKALNL